MMPAAKPGDDFEAQQEEFARALININQNLKYGPALYMASKNLLKAIDLEIRNMPPNDPSSIEKIKTLTRVLSSSTSSIIQVQKDPSELNFQRLDKLSQQLPSDSVVGRAFKAFAGVIAFAACSMALALAVFATVATLGGATVFGSLAVIEFGVKGMAASAGYVADQFKPSESGKVPTSVSDFKSALQGIKAEAAKDDKKKLEDERPTLNAQR